MSYKPHESLVAPAREKSDILRLIVGLVTIALLYVVMLMLGGSLASAIMCDAWVQTAAMTPGLTTPTQMLTILASFGFMIGAVCLAVILLHHRHPVTILGGWRPSGAQFLPLSGVNRRIHFLRRRLTIQSLVWPVVKPPALHSIFLADPSQR